jgi:hypothetical protein
MSRLTRVLVACLTLCPPVIGMGGAEAGTAPRYRYAYFLFAAGQVADNADASIPLLLTRRPLEQASTADADPCCVVVWTYERDSVSLVRQGTDIRAEHVKAQERHVQIPGLAVGGIRHWYRYQRVALSEARQLLTHPEGVIPVHRIGLSHETLDALQASLQDGE